ncbi:hypothetical protein [Nocardia transvalensis]|uniref:hypothetical protein n=1 Tax=Nocardia transvalensis TaxID=37333 RepID=UPI00189601B9|nr:hypothetical protein [Nocardia transvalensis]MBF6331488.1 hypothetical protein [Nocardia transvalensis]
MIVAGAEPTGLTPAAELYRGGAEVLLLDQRGIVDRFLAAGRRTQLGNFAGIVLDYSPLPTRSPYTLNITPSR